MHQEDSPPHLKYVSTLLLKLENHNCCWFQWQIACETSEFILQDMKPLY